MSVIWGSLGVPQINAQVRFASPKGEFEVVLPTGWQSMGEVQLGDLNKFATNFPVMLNGKQAQHGFFPDAVDNNGFPRLVVSIDYVGRATDEEISNVARDLKVSLAAYFDQQLFTNVSPASLVVSLESDKRLLWLRMPSTPSLPGGRSVSGIIGSYFTDIGTVSFIGAAPSEAFTEFEPIFTAIIRSAKFPFSAKASSTPTAKSDAFLRGLGKWGTIFGIFIAYGVYQGLKPWLKARREERERRNAPDPRTTVSCRCSHCGSLISYEMKLDGSLSECPSCHKETTLDF